MTSEHFTNETQQGEKLSVFPSPQLIILKLPPDDTTQKDAKRDHEGKGEREREGGRGKDHRPQII